MENYQILISSFVIILGWVVAHYLSANRDHANKKREVRLEYLINAYRELGMAAARKPNSKYFQNLEKAFHDVQLFGSTEQLTHLNNIFLEHSKCGGANLEPLLNSLRKELRDLLGQEEAGSELKFFRTES